MPSRSAPGLASVASLAASAFTLSLALAAAAPALAVAAPELAVERLIIVGRTGPGAPWTDRPTEATLAEAPELAIVALAKEGKRAVVVADPDLTPLSLAGRAVAASARRPWEEAGVAEVSWSLVEPRGFRSVPAANGATSDYYSNVSTEPDSFGKWLGYDRIEYFETPLGPPAAGASARRISAMRAGTDERTPPEIKRALGTTLLGTVRYRARAALAGGKIVETPGAAATDTYGILPSVHRVSIRAGDDFLGYLGAYLLVPEVFGSAGGGAQHQTERYTGADCADVMVGALRKSGRRDVPYTNVASLPRYATLVEPALALDAAGRGDRALASARPGDLIRLDYGGALAGKTPRSWDHVAAWWEDRSDPAGPHRGAADGLLDGFDLVIHMGHPRLVIEPLSAQSPATIDVLRWKPARGTAPRR
jgi:hypothetical protein